MNIEVSVCVCVCFSKEKRNKRESRPKERREVGENVWWGVGLGEGTRGPQKNMLTLTSSSSSSSSSSFFIFYFLFFLSEWDVTLLLRIWPFFFSS